MENSSSRTRRVYDYIFSSTVRGYHVYQRIWTPDYTTEYSCLREPNNEYDPNAVAVYHDKEVVGHIPKEHAYDFSEFLKSDGSRLSCRITGKSYWDQVTELPCRYIFYNQEMEKIKELRKKLEAKNLLSIKKEELDMISSRMGTIKGHMKVQRVFLHGPPAVGKSSIQRIIAGQEPLKQNEQNSTGIMQPPERLVATNRLLTRSTNQQPGVFKKVDEYVILRLITRELRNALIQDEEDNADKINFVLDFIDETDLTLPRVSLAQSKSESIANHVSKSAELKDHLVGKIAKNLKEITKKFVDSFFSVLWVHLIDSGGQPQFTDLLPLVYPSENNLIFFVIRLDQRLDQQDYSEILKNGVRHRSSEVLTLTSYQMIENVCKMAKLSGSRVKIIGTHLDRINECGETQEEKEKQLESLKEKYETVLILEENENLIYALNAMEENSEKREEYQQKLNRLILNSEMPLCVDEEVPLQWLILQLLMNRESHNGVLTYAEVQEFASSLCISDVDCAEALQFFSKLALSFFFPEVVSDVVIDDLGVLTSRISEIIRSTFDVPTNRPPTESLIAFRKTGIFDKCLLLKLCPRLPIKNFTIDHLLCILQHLKMIHALPPSDVAHPDDSTKYFFPGILPPAPTDNNCPLSVHKPLLLFWEDIPLPHAFFSTMVVTLLEKENITLCRGQKTQHYRNLIHLQCRGKSTGNSMYVGVISLVNKINWMEIFLCSGTLNFAFVRETMLSQIEVVLTTHLKKPSLVSSCKLGLLCPKECGNDENHPGILMDGMNNQFLCTLDGVSIWSEEKMQWFYSADCSGQIQEPEAEKCDNNTGYTGSKRPSPSKDEISNKEKKSRLNKKQYFSLQNILSSPELSKLTTCLYAQGLISDTTHYNVLNSGVLISELVTCLETDINSTIKESPDKLPEIRRVLKEQDDPKLIILADTLV